jgi:hypothetical protein
MSSFIPKFNPQDVPVPEVVTKASEIQEVPVDRDKEKAKEIQDRMSMFEKKFGGFSNIPLEHEYWGLRNELQRLTME